MTPSPSPPLLQNNNTTGSSTRTEGAIDGESHTAGLTTTTTAATRTTTAVHNPPKTTTPGVVQNVTFANLRKLLLQLVGNREMYESYCNQQKKSMMFRVELAARVRNQNDLYFDVIKAAKKKGSKKSKGKKYEFFASARFQCGSTVTGASSISPNTNSTSSAASTSSSGTADSNVTLSCRIHPGLIEPHFEIPAHELRALNRTNRAESLRITNDNGEKFREAYFSRRYWRATLNLTSDELFGKEESESTLVSSLDTASERLTDLKSPVLLLEADNQ